MGYRFGQNRPTGPGAAPREKIFSTREPLSRRFSLLRVQGSGGGKADGSQPTRTGTVGVVCNVRISLSSPSERSFSFSGLCKQSTSCAVCGRHWPERWGHLLLYKDSQGGSRLWLETQNVETEKNGHYTVMLGSTTSQGLPADLFDSGGGALVRRPTGGAS
jgi:hypothetical protein